MSLPTPHLEKLNATLQNDKLPHSERSRVEAAIERYSKWISSLSNVEGDSDTIIEKMVNLLDEYKHYIDMDLIFDSPNDFLYRQKGQLKLDNSIIEEFLPWLINPSVIPELADDITSGPTTCFSSIYFSSKLDFPTRGGGMHIRSKAQDFALSRKLFIKTSHNPDFSDPADGETYIAYIAIEVKTNLDKTMFQEACATAHDVNSVVSGAKYFLLCEWLDMTPLSTAPTDIDEILILRCAKRLSSNIRKNFSSKDGRQKNRDGFENFLKTNPFKVEVFKRIVNHIKGVLDDDDPNEEDVLVHGFF